MVVGLVGKLMSWGIQTVFFSFGLWTRAEYSRRAGDFGCWSFVVGNRNCDSCIGGPGQ